MFPPSSSYLVWVIPRPPYALFFHVGVLAVLQLRPGLLLLCPLLFCLVVAGVGCHSFASLVVGRYDLARIA